MVDAIRPITAPRIGCSDPGIGWVPPRLAQRRSGGLLLQGTARSRLRPRNPLYRPETPPMISVSTRRDRLVGFAAQKRLPAIYHFHEYAVAGGLISYGPNFADSYKNAGTYVGRILKGRKACRPAAHAADQIRFPDQSEDSQRARTNAARRSRRGDRIGRDLLA